MRHDVVEETVALRDREIAVLRPRDADALIDPHAFADDEFLPYWAELWPSGVALARAVSARALRGARVLELGCGLGVPSVAAALAGGRVLATDWSAEALDYAQVNAERNGAHVDVERCSWEEPEPLVARAPWDLVLAADVLYERRNVPLLLDLLPRLAGDRGAVWLADPRRDPAEAFLAEAGDRWHVETTAEREPPGPAIHRLTRRRAP